MKKENRKEVMEQLGMFDAGYKFKLDNFEGPLDLLLHLIKESKMEIFEVRLADITEQYLDYLSGLDELDMDKASDFIDVATTLIEIKSKSLLPKENVEEGEEEDSETALLRQLQELQVFKDVCERLKKYENVDRFYKAPDDKVNDYRYVLGDMNIEGLLNAFANMMTRVIQKKASKEIGDKKIEKDRWTVAEKIISIRSNLKENKKMKFTELFDEDYTKSEMINIFLAVLELLKMQLAIVRQEGIYNDIEIEAREELLNAEWY